MVEFAFANEVECVFAETLPEYWPSASKLAGAPRAGTAGIDLHVRNGDFVERGEPLFTLHAESPGELAYALDYATAQSDTVHVVEDA